MQWQCCHLLNSIKRWPDARESSVESIAALIYPSHRLPPSGLDMVLEACTMAHRSGSCNGKCLYISDYR